MFDLDFLEDDYRKNSFILSEEEIIEIYRKDGATYSNYSSEVDKFKKLTTIVSAEDRLLGLLFGDKEILDKVEEEERLKEKYEYPKKKHLSRENQKLVVEGALHIVFDATRKWYKFFDEKVSLEEIYYVCLNALINSVKYLVHSEKPAFKFYVEESIRKNIIKYVAKINHTNYREMYNIIDSGDVSHVSTSSDEYLLKPTDFYYLLRDESYNVDYIKNISSLEFMYDYKEEINNLDDISKLVMQMSFDNDGNRGLTVKEISDYLGISTNEVRNTRRRTIKSLRKNKVFDCYRNI